MPVCARQPDTLIEGLAPIAARFPVKVVISLPGVYVAIRAAAAGDRGR